MDHRRSIIVNNIAYYDLALSQGKIKIQDYDYILTKLFQMKRFLKNGIDFDMIHKCNNCQKI